jgi:hypothetical protein
MKKKKSKSSDLQARTSIHPLKAPVFQNDTLARDFLRSPKTFAKKLGIPLESLACPSEAHAALKRGEAFAKKVASKKIKLDEESIQDLRKIASAQFGRDYEVSFIPFRLQFREKMKIDPAIDWTATGTASVTWLDSDADVDG